MTNHIDPISDESENDSDYESLPEANYDELSPLPLTEDSDDDSALAAEDQTYYFGNDDSVDEDNYCSTDEDSEVEATTADDILESIRQGNDYQFLLDEAPPEEIRLVVNTILTNYLENNVVECPQALESLVSSNSKGYQPKLTQCLQHAIKHDHENIEFFLGLGANKEKCIISAINNDDANVLATLDVDFEEKYLELAIDDEQYQVITYFLQKDFEATSEILLDAVVEQQHEEFLQCIIEEVINNSSNVDNDVLDEAIKLLEKLIEKGGKELIPQFFNYFKPEKLLIEILQEDQELYLKVKHYYEVFESSRTADKPSITDSEELTELEGLLEQLDVNDKPTTFPKKGYSGDNELAKLRRLLFNDSFMSKTNKAAASWIGVNCSTSINFLVPSPSHRVTLAESNSYIRSSKHFSRFFAGDNIYVPHKHLPEALVKEKGMGIEAHLGLYQHPLITLGLNQKPDSHQFAKKQKITANDNYLYDALLNYHIKIGKYIVAQIDKKTQQILQVGLYHNYPCVMIYPKPHWEIDKNWTSLFISYLIAIVNSKAQIQGLGIELITRPSFGFFTPTLADCDNALRLNVGLIPLEYANIIVESLKDFAEVLSYCKTSGNSLTHTLKQDLFCYTADYRAYSGNKPILPVTDIFKFANTRVEKRGGTALHSLVRTRAACVDISADIYQRLILKKTDSTHKKARVFIDALSSGFNRLAIKGKSLSYIKGGDVKFKLLNKDPMRIQDNHFFQLVATISQRYKKIEPARIIIKNMLEKAIRNIDESIEQKTIDGIHYNLVMLNEILYANVVSSQASEGYDSGSDSEVEDDSCSVKTYGKKAIVQNGMRAILAAIHAGFNHLSANRKNNSKDLFLGPTYHETYSALKLFKDVKVYDKPVEIKLSKMIFFDANPCVKTLTVPVLPTSLQLENKVVLIVDTTSATMETYAYWYEEFVKSKSAALLFFAASGLKNEQVSSDRNPYGTIRVFAKNSRVLAKTIEFIKKHEEPITSKISQEFRRFFKSIGAIPSNNGVIKQREQKQEISVRP
jgi:hypothetical protein